MCTRTLRRVRRSTALPITPGSSSQTAAASRVFSAQLPRFDGRLLLRYSRNAGWSSLVARRAHNPKVVSSNLTPATILDSQGRRPGLRPFCLRGSGKVELRSGLKKTNQSMHFHKTRAGMRSQNQVDSYLCQLPPQLPPAGNLRDSALSLLSSRYCKLSAIRPGTFLSQNH